MNNILNTKRRSYFTTGNDIIRIDLSDRAPSIAHKWDGNWSASTKEKHVSKMHLEQVSHPGMRTNSRISCYQIKFNEGAPLPGAANYTKDSDH